ncbi:hypothetical protein PPTG_15816 [Phytophthora nicotianae INRA-310]|uniref:Uncharacterized protein n=1 Tax=Phytophthora nicotianae (strain INRA-310) TaxID=761204 RepID=W2PPS0_PHYN3|nr:hypothetical protein PPTG_15816 [Phytophthora nicotianae INRA-310]ETN02857.1 hypothetical protein PPTG_15816 [Phytophthora nicotianae INRA-310]
MMQASLQYPLVILFAFFITLAVNGVSTGNPIQTPATPPQSLDQQLNNAPSVRLHIMLKGKNMQIHGQSVFDVFAKPVISADPTSVRYDGFATFIQWDSKFTSMVVDGSAYVVESTGDDTTSVATRTVRCLSSITPFDSIVDALNNLTAVSTEAVGDDSEVDCNKGSLYETSFGGKHFMVCAPGADGFIAYGGDITMVVEYLDSPLTSLSTPNLTDGSVSCPAVVKPTSVSPTTVAFLIGKEASPTCASLESDWI